MPALRHPDFVVIQTTSTYATGCVFCGEPVADDNCVDYSDEGLGGIAHEVCPETLLDNGDLSKYLVDDSQW